MIAIVTDSTCDLPAGMVEQYHIEVVPIYVHIGDATFRAGIDITNEQFIQRMQSSPDLPVSEPPSVDDFRQVYARLAPKYEQILSIHLSNHLSKTYAHAVAAREALGSSAIHVFDTLSNSGGLGLMVIEAARLAGQGQPLEAILKQLEAMSRHHRFYFTVETLDYLRRSGRIDRLRHLVGTVFQMKPVMTLQAGQIELLETVRTKSKAVARLRQLSIDALAGRSHIHLSVFHVAALDEAQRLMADLVEAVEPAHTLMCDIGPSIAANVGPGAVGLAFYSDK